MSEKSLKLDAIKADVEPHTPVNKSDSMGEVEKVSVSQAPKGFRYRERNGALYQVPRDLDDDVDEHPPSLMHVDNSTVFESKKVDYYTSLQNIVSSEIREVNKTVKNKPPATKMRWSKKHQAQVDNDKETLYDWFKNGVVYKATAPRITKGLPDENAYDETLSQYIRTKKDDKKLVLGDFVTQGTSTNDVTFVTRGTSMNDVTNSSSSDSSESMNEGEKYDLNDLIIVTRAKAKLVESTLPTRKRTFFERITRDYLRDLQGLADMKGDFTRSNERATVPPATDIALVDIMDRTNECKNLLCKHQVKPIVDHFIRSVYQGAEKVLATLPISQIDTFRQAIEKLVIIIQLSYDHYQPRLFPPLCVEDECPHKDNSGQDITSKAKLFGNVVTTSDPKTSFEEKCHHLMVHKRPMGSEEAVLYEKLNRDERILEGLTKTIYQEARVLLDTLPKSESLILKRAVRAFMRTIRDLQSETQVDETCGCTKWFKRSTDTPTSNFVTVDLTETEKETVTQELTPEQLSNKLSDTGSDSEVVIIQPEQISEVEIHDVPSMGTIDIIPMEQAIAACIVTEPNNNLGTEVVQIN
jgi:hypothetical protein